jgi:hypothetical protein
MGQGSSATDRPSAITTCPLPISARRLTAAMSESGKVTLPDFRAPAEAPAAPEGSIGTGEG